MGPRRINVKASGRDVTIHYGRAGKRGIKRASLVADGRFTKEDRAQLVQQVVAIEESMAAQGR